MMDVRYHPLSRIVISSRGECKGESCAFCELSRLLMKKVPENNNFSQAYPYRMVYNLMMYRLLIL